MRVLVTGATGFVGATLCGLLAQRGYEIRAALRSDRETASHIAEKAIVGDIGGDTQWLEALRGVHAVVHLAARVHERSGSSERAAYMEINARGTKRLAEVSAAAGVRTFLFLSTIKVNGEESEAAYSAVDPPHPTSDYAISKWLGERSLEEVAAATGMHAAIVRPPLVYGPGVRANFLRLMRGIDKGLPLPFGAVDNRRSLVSVWNLCDLLIRLLGAGEAAHGTWMVADEESVSTAELARRIGHAMGKRVWLPSIPIHLLKVVAKAAGRATELQRLCGSLVVDIDQTRSRLGWSPPVILTEGLSRTVDWYRRAVGSRGRGD